MTGEAPHFIHGTAVVLGEGAVLIRGASGAGKSQLALALLALAQGRGIFARLVGDDRVGLEVSAGRLIVSPHPATLGMIEQRGTGIINKNIALAGILRLCVDLERDVARLPEDAGTETELLGLRLPRLAVRQDLGPQEIARRVLEAMNCP